VIRLCLKILLGMTFIAALSACVTTTVDEMVFNVPTEGIGDASVVILGRRHASDYDTEVEFIQFVGKYIRARDRTITVIDEVIFLNTLYPWFEPRTAPLRAPDLENLINNEAIAEKVVELKLQYMIWIDGSTVRSGSTGSMSCGVGPGGGGCLGFSTWSDDSKYEAVIWDFKERAEVGRVNATATGQSYMPALVVPIPIIAPVKDTACDSISAQLLEFLSSEY
jgi:hypothetical protein